MRDNYGHMRERHTLGQRIRAAMYLGGFESLAELAGEVGLTNLSGKSLSRTVNGRRTAEPHELEAIARTCGLPPVFFTMDLARLAERPSNGRPAVAEEPTPAALAVEVRKLGEALREQNLRLEALELADRARSDEEDQRDREAQ
jgi:transcriptional regulator with XRE-family HTH domain